MTDHEPMRDADAIEQARRDLTAVQAMLERVRGTPCWHEPAEQFRLTPIG